MDSLGSGAALVLAVLGILGLVAGTVPYFKSRWLKASIEALEGDRDRLQRRVDIVEDDLTAEQRKTATLQEKVAELEAARSVLEKVVTGREQLERVLNLLEGRTPMFNDIEQHLTGIESRLDAIEGAVSRP